MLKQLSVSQKIFGTVILLFVWGLFTEQVSADAPTGVITFVTKRQGFPLGDRVRTGVFVINAEGLHEDWWRISSFSYGPIAWSPDGKSIAYHLQDPRSAHIFVETPALLPEGLEESYISAPKEGHWPVIAAYF